MAAPPSFSIFTVDPQDHHASAKLVPRTTMATVDLQNTAEKGFEKHYRNHQKGFESKKKRVAHMASGGTENRGQKVGSMASGSSEPRQKGTLWLRALTEAKSCALLASPQYASVREPVQNMINNRCQRPFLHW